MCNKFKLIMPLVLLVSNSYSFCEMNLATASRYGYTDKVRLLVRAGADVNKVTDENPPIYEAVYGGHLEVVNLLVSHGANLAVVDAEGRTLLHCAVRRNHVGLVHMSLSAGVGVTAIDERGRTPLHFVSCAEVAQALLSYGAEVNATDHEGWTPLHNVAWNCKDQVAQVLLSAEQM